MKHTKGKAHLHGGDLVVPQTHRVRELLLLLLQPRPPALLLVELRLLGLEQSLVALSSRREFCHCADALSLHHY